MNVFEQGVARYIGEESLRRLQKVRVGIAGAGGLGSNCAATLVRCGFARFVIADFDMIEPSNLNRQFFLPGQVGQPKAEALKANLLAINPDLEVEVHTTRVEQGNVDRLFGNCDAVVEAFDCPRSKKMLVEHVLPTGKFLVAASGIAGWGATDALKTRMVRDNFCLVGDGRTEATDSTPPVSPTVTIAAAKQADAIFTYFMEKRHDRT